MVLLHIIVGGAITVGIILLRYYLLERKKESKNNKHCFNCNLDFPNNHTVCPRCGLRFGA